jgi:hydroxymethylglutaryl-CoA reductase (NADPH)
MSTRRLFCSSASDPSMLRPVAAVAAAAAASAWRTTAPLPTATAAIRSALQSGRVKHHQLERLYPDVAGEELVALRRQFLAERGVRISDKLPMSGVAYDQVRGTNCESVVGAVALPVGIVGPLVVDGKAHYVPMATTEGALVASTQRGASVIGKAGGTTTYVQEVGMTRAPALDMGSLRDSRALDEYVTANFPAIAEAFNKTTRFGKLLGITVHLMGRYAHLRFRASTADAMGMNMVSKGTEAALQHLQSKFPNMRVMALSGNMCTDKKSAAINWIEGRGRKVNCEARIPFQLVRDVLKVDPLELVHTHLVKNYYGSAAAGTVGGNNAHAANVVAAIYIATGQDPAQVVGSSMAQMVMHAEEKTQTLYTSVTMNCMELGTVGGGTTLPAQRGALDMLDLPEQAGERSHRLASIIASTVLAGELSLMSALTEGSLVRAHMALNRAPPSSPTSHSEPDTPA